MMQMASNIIQFDTLEDSVIRVEMIPKSKSSSRTRSQVKQSLLVNGNFDTDVLKAITAIDSYTSKNKQSNLKNPFAVERLELGLPTPSPRQSQRECPVEPMKHIAPVADPNSRKTCKHTPLRIDIDEKDNTAQSGVKGFEYLPSIACGYSLDNPRKPARSRSAFSPRNMTGADIIKPVNVVSMANDDVKAERNEITTTVPDADIDNSVSLESSLGRSLHCFPMKPSLTKSAAVPGRLFSTSGDQKDAMLKRWQRRQTKITKDTRCHTAMTSRSYIRNFPKSELFGSSEGHSQGQVPTRGRILRERECRTAPPRIKQQLSVQNKDLFTITFNHNASTSYGDFSDIIEDGVLTSDYYTVQRVTSDQTRQVSIPSAVTYDDNDITLSGQTKAIHNRKL
ncbi:unnamed protein product [Owenia fusiformis]|uniref:Uncharacterized protein n=1 Tax=Owenia fusiformis TaxID=6347 RepID=A0A8J1U595_OWEFU|nr:unnamed protein product [Owenia fusiformis]